MALNLASGLQVSAHFFWQRRNAAALSHHGVRMEFDPVQRQRAALILGFVFALLGVALMFLVSWFKPAGHVGQSQILADRDTGAVFVLVDGRLHPALNLVSARLIAGQASNPTFVKASELAKYPQGPTVGIGGAPMAMPLRTGDASQWAICDTASAGQTSGRPVVTAIGGLLTVGERTQQLIPPKAVLVTHNDATYVVWDGHRSQVDLSNKAVALALGVDSAAPQPIPLSNVLFDALPATEPLTTPAVPNAGAPGGWNLGPGAVVGSVLSVRDLQTGSDNFYVLLSDGVQRISPFVASLLRSANSYGNPLPLVVAPDKLTRVPVVNSLPVYYPATRLTFVDTAANPVTCVAWSKGSTDRSAVTTVLSGKGLPIPIGSDSRLLQLVKDARGPAGIEADQVYMAPGATNLVMTTSAAPDANSRESLWWISDQGVRYGISLDDESLRSLGITPGMARQAPWPLIRVFAAGPALTRADAMTQHDTMSGLAEAALLGKPQ